MSSLRHVAVVRGPTSTFTWDMDSGETRERTESGTPPAEIAAIIAHRPQVNGHCERCGVGWPCGVIRVLEEHRDYVASIIRYGRSDHHA